MLNSYSCWRVVSTTLVLLLGVLTTCVIGKRVSITDTSCFPLAETSRPQFMVGYGSLMQNKSKHLTAPGTGPSIPVRISGFRRGWNTRSIGYPYQTTFLGVVPDPDAALNVIIFELPSGDSANLTKTLALYDTREDLYCRHAVPVGSITSLAADYTLDPKAQYWMYINRPDSPPDQRSSAEFPIVQSYVDVFISGCLELEAQYNLSKQQFATSCVRDTSGWDSCWVNDRIYPRRPFVHQPRVLEIDALLQKYATEAFKAIKLEGQCSASGSSGHVVQKPAGAWSLFAVATLLFVFHPRTTVSEYVSLIIE